MLPERACGMPGRGNDMSFDTVIIGAGQAGVPLSKALAGKGQTVALIEAEELGGSCVNFGCTPTKAVIASARAARGGRHGPTRSPPWAGCSRS